ncbi:MAG: hypothetical protein M3Z08_04250 [Chloroflexota bacterium]|nr:hypothetical protein [Chloroflexota bacterium]
MPVNDPWLGLQRRWQRFLVISIVLLGIGLLVYMVSLFLPTFKISLNNVSSIVYMGGIFVFVTLSFLSQKKAVKRHTQQHQRMLAGDVNLLAQEQPSPNEHGLSLPTKIALRPKRGTINWIYGILGFMALFFAGLTIWALVVFFTTPYDAYYTGDDPIVAALTGICALFFGGLCWFVWWRLRYWVKATEMGLEARLNGRRMWIAWEDARFFSVEGSGFKDEAYHGQRLVYTLSGEQGGVTWLQLLSEHQSGLQRPVLPFDQYQQQSQALLELVASRTNLPLHDMRLLADE